MVGFIKGEEMYWAPAGHIKTTPFISFFNDIYNPSLKTTNTITKSDYRGFSPHLQLPQNVSFSIFCGVCVYRDSRLFQNSNFTLEISSNYEYKSKLVIKKSTYYGKTAIHTVGLNKCKILFMITEPLNNGDDGSSSRSNGEISCTLITSQMRTYKKTLYFEIIPPPPQPSSSSSPPHDFIKSIDRYYYPYYKNQRLYCFKEKKVTVAGGEGGGGGIQYSPANIYFSSSPINVWSVQHQHHQQQQQQQQKRGGGKGNGFLSPLIIESMNASILPYEKLLKYNNDDDYFNNIIITCSTFNPFNLKKVKQIHHHISLQKKYISNNNNTVVSSPPLLLLSIIIQVPIFFYQLLYFF